MRNDSAKKTALGGILAAVSLVIMWIGGMIPVATYACPVLCMVVGCLVLRFCGKKYAWCWYAAVAILSLLIGPDKEAAAVFLFLGYYPMLKKGFETACFSWLLKLLYFNIVIVVLYWLLIFVFGLEGLYEEFSSAGVIGLAVVLILGNVTFLLTDKVLSKFLPKR